MKTRKSIGEKMVAGLQEFVADLKAGVNIEAKYTCHTVVMNVQPQSYNARRVRETRKLLSCSQTVFSGLLGVSVKTVSSWEQGASIPQDVACRFMDEIRHNPDYWRQRLRELVVSKKEIGSKQGTGRKRTIRA